MKIQDLGLRHSIFELSRCLEYVPYSSVSLLPSIPCHITNKGI